MASVRFPLFNRKSSRQTSVEGKGAARQRAAGELTLRFFGLTLKIASVAGRTPPGQIGLMILMAWLFVGVPDIDLALMPILHHRSVITHSALPALLFLALGRGLGAAPIAGALIGISVHLASDLISPMVGFAQIWLPRPFLTPLGSWSYLWLGANAFIGYFLALRIAMATLHVAVAVPFTIALSGITGAAYGAFNEQSVASVMVSVLFPALTWGWLLLKSRATANQR